MKIFKYLLFLVIIGCNNSKKTNLESYPSDVIENNLEYFYDKAKWEVYSWNLMRGEDYFDAFSDPNGKNVLTNFESLDLFYKYSFKKNDTLTMVFDFSTEKFQPFKSDLHTQVSFIDTTIIGLDLFDRIGIIYDSRRSIPNIENAFAKYLQSKEPSELNPWLLKEAKKRKVLE